MNYLPEKGYLRVLVLTFYIVLGVALTYLFFKYVLSFIVPFIIAWIISMLIRPLTETLHKRMGIPIKILSLIFVLLILAILGGLIFIGFDKILYELRGIVVYLNKNGDNFIHIMLDKINSLLENIPFLKTFGSDEELLAMLSGVSGNILAGFSTKIPEIIKDLITAIPNMLFVALILIMASYYFSADGRKMAQYSERVLPKEVNEKIKSAYKKLKEAGIRIFKGYLLTVMITFVQLYVGFSVIKTEYAFTIAIITALVDVLPILGVGTVLVPWSLFKLLAGNYYQGFGLLIIFAIVSVVREILQPKIIGNSIGLHPLMTLFSMYMGLKLSGFWGMLAFPVFCIAIKSFFVNDGKAKDVL